MITPFEYTSVSKITDVLGIGESVVSFGPSSYGYDARLAPHFKVFTAVPGLIMDVKFPDPRLFTDFEG
jgi:deoxycytidine triphosphate deaminase